MNLDVVFTLAGDIRWNSRALKQLRALRSMGYEVMALGIGDAEVEVHSEDTGTIRILKRPSGGGPRFFRKVHRLMHAQSMRLPASVYHASDLYTLPAVSHAASHYSARLVYDARELYPHVASTAGRPWVQWFWRFLEGRYIKQADLVCTVSQSIASHLADTYSISTPLILYNVPERVPVVSAGELHALPEIPDGVKIVLHQGNIQKNRGCFTLVEAMKQVDDGLLVFLGGGPMKPALEEHVHASKLSDKVKFLPPVAPQLLLRYTASACVGVTLLEDTCLNHRYALPNKLFEYLMAGVPVIASRLPEISAVVDRFNVGILVDPSSPEEVAAAIRRIVADNALRDDLSGNIPPVFETFSWENASQEFLRYYHNLLVHSTRP